MKNIDTVKHGDWIFTCRMTPEQFDKFNPRDPKKYGKKYLASLTEEEYSNFINNDFQTIIGSNHSFNYCGCKVISEAYAKWFLDNNIHLLFDKHEKADPDNVWVNYEAEVKQLAEEAGLTYEGV
jgi:hypothetical protein